MKEEKVKMDKAVLARYLKGNGSPGDENVIQQWLDSPDTEKELYEESLGFWDEIDSNLNITGYSGDRILDGIHHRIRIEEGLLSNRKKLNIGFVGYLTRIAAILFVPVLIASLFLYFQSRPFRNEVSWAEIQAPFGTRTTFYLPDGSTGFLNGGSSLKFQNQFTTRIRRVELTGEAYFNVISNKRRPFIVSTQNIDIKVTGTSFNIMAYPDDPTTEVTLEKGRIEVFKKINGESESLAVLQPDESLIYNSLSDSSNISSVNTEDKLSWIEGKMVFKYEPFQSVITKLNRWYNVNITIKDDALDSYIYYGTFQNESLDEVLKLLQYTSPIRYNDFEREKKQDGTFEKRKIEIYIKK